MISALDGREALARLAEHADVDLIFLDINMPAMNGLELLGQIKGQPPLAGIPVIIVSTEGREEDTVRGLKAGAAAYVRKPFRAEAVLALVERVLARQAPPLAAPDRAAG
jgi:CheY-like chemotaxis protein